MFDLTNENIIKRFWDKVKIGKEDECWEWKEGKFNVGYGRFYYNNKTYGTHIVAFAINIKVWPTGLIIRHSCNNRACCNPKHLIEGTQKDNVQDIIKTGNHRTQNQSGEKHHRTSLTNEEVIELRELSDYFSPNRILRIPKYKNKITKSVLEKIINYDTWRHIK